MRHRIIKRVFPFSAISLLCPTVDHCMPGVLQCRDKSFSQLVIMSIVN